MYRLISSLALMGSLLTIPGCREQTYTPAKDVCAQTAAQPKRVKDFAREMPDVKCYTVVTSTAAGCCIIDYYARGTEPMGARKQCGTPAQGAPPEWSNEITMVGRENFIPGAVVRLEKGTPQYLAFREQFLSDTRGLK